MMKIKVQDVDFVEVTLFSVVDIHASTREKRRLIIKNIYIYI